MLFTFCSINKIKIKKLSCLRALFANRDFQLYSLFSTFNNIQRDILFHKLLYVMCVCNQWNPPKLITFSLLCTCHLLLDCPLWLEWTLHSNSTSPRWVRTRRAEIHGMNTEKPSRVMKQCLRITELMHLTSGDREQPLGEKLGWFGGLCWVWPQAEWDLVPDQQSSLFIRAIFPQTSEVKMTRK